MKKHRLSSHSLNVILGEKIRYKIKIILNKIFDYKIYIQDIRKKRSSKKTYLEYFSQLLMKVDKVYQLGGFGVSLYNTFNPIPIMLYNARHYMYRDRKLWVYTKLG